MLLFFTTQVRLSRFHTRAREGDKMQFRGGKGDAVKEGSPAHLDHLTVTLLPVTVQRSWVSSPSVTVMLGRRPVILSSPGQREIIKKMLLLYVTLVAKPHLARKAPQCALHALTNTTAGS